MKKWAKTKCLLIWASIILSAFAHSQSISIKGKIIATNDVSGIHVINQSLNTFTITNDAGEFTIVAALNDSIYFSALQYQPKTVIVDSYTINTEQLLVKLVERVTELDEVLIGQVLTGDLRSDIENSNVKAALNFYDLGIPGYTGKPKTQSERRLYEADNGKFVNVYPLFVSININKVLNRISGRTKEMKNRVRLERQDLCMDQSRSYFSEALFNIEKVPEEVITEFFYYASEDPKFLELCQLNNDMKLYDFLVSKLVAFNSEYSETED